MPVLKAEAYHNVDETESAGAYARAWAMEGYLYSGDSKNITLTAILTGDVYEPDGSDTSITGITGSITIYGENSSYEYDTYLTLSDEVVGGSYTASIVFSVEDGDIFYLEAVLEAYGVLGGSYADAFSTLNVEFDDYTGLTAMSASAVPVPGSVFLLVSGMACIVGFGRGNKKG
jgi:hypothetical protein